MLVDGTASSTTTSSSDSSGIIMNNGDESTASVVVVAAHTLDDSPVEIPAGPPGMLSTPGPPHQQTGAAPLPPPQQPPPPHGGIIEYHDPPDTKEGIEELCPVCGDKVSGYHYGLLTCESCKGFFKRTVQNKKVYTCVADRTCHIDKSQRKRCPYCRFQKCLDVGMKLEAVRADRMRGGRNKFGPMYKRDRARKQQRLRQQQIARAQCQGVAVSNEVIPCGPQPFPPPAGVSSSPSVYTNNPHIKQELIQIPQLSSSTSSPDSSPSPLCTAVQTVQTSMSASAAHFAMAATVSGAPPPPPPPTAASVPSAHESPSKASGAVLPWHPVPPPSPHSHPQPQQQQQQPQQHHPHHHNATTTTNSNNNASPLSPKGYGNHAAYADSLPPAVLSSKLPPLIREYLSTMPDDKDWQSQLFHLLQSQTYNQCEVDLFELMCKVIDQSLFAQVDWARNSIFFKDLKVDDQMKLLQHSWSDMLILDHLHQRLHNGLPEETTMANGQKFDLVTLALLGVPSMVDQLHHVSARLQELKFDHIDYICLKFLLLLNPAEVRSLSNMKLVHEAFEQTQQVLLEYTMTVYPQVTDKFTQLLQVLPEIRVISERGEDFLLFRHLNGNAPTQTLLMEMLHAKKK